MTGETVASLEKERKMESYSHFFQTLHDERSPTGRLGNGTHASILRAIVFHDPTLTPLTSGASADLAVIWDEDHDTRVIQAVELIYRAGFLGSILMIGERKGTLNAIVSEQVQDPKLLSSLDAKLRTVAQKMEGDPWSSSLRMFDSPNHEIIDDDDANVSLYLKNLKMLWRLGVNVSAEDKFRAKMLARSKERKTATTTLLDALVKSIPGEGDDADKARADALRNALDQLEAEKIEGAKAARKIRLVES